MAYENNHYIPQFILRRFDTRIDLYDVSDGSLHPDQRPERIFSEWKIYPEDLEKSINTQLEGPFAQLLHSKLTTGKCGDRIVLTREDLLLMKRFFALETMRVPQAEMTLEKVRRLSHVLAEVFPDFEEKEIPGETATQRWQRNLRVIIESENLLTVAAHPLCTYETLNWARIISDGYFAIWDCAGSSTDFLITDIGLTSEVEPAKLTDGFEHTKIDTLVELMNREKSSARINDYDRLLSAQTLFHENFYLFPLTRSRMVVTVNPFFMLYDKKAKLIDPARIWPTEIKDLRLFEKNPPLRDGYVYTVQQISNRDAEYINMLMLDRVNRFLGYAEWNRIEHSVERYIDFHKKKGMRAPVNYLPLLAMHKTA